MAFRAVVFDLFDTLVYMTPTGTRDLAQARIEAAGIANEEWRRAWRAVLPEALRGEIRTLRERIARALQLTGVSPEQSFVDELAGLLLCRDYPQLFAETRAVLALTRERGYRVGLISNTTSYDRFIFDAFELAPSFDAAVFSSEVALLKPEPEIFLLTAQQLDVAPAACVFVDDRLDYCSGARQAGMTAVHLDRPEHVSRHSGEADLRVENLQELLAWLPQRVEEG